MSHTQHKFIYYACSEKTVSCMVRTVCYRIRNTFWLIIPPLLLWPISRTKASRHTSTHIATHPATHIFTHHHIPRGTNTHQHLLTHTNTTNTHKHTPPHTIKYQHTSTHTNTHQPTPIHTTSQPNTLQHTSPHTKSYQYHPFNDTAPISNILLSFYLSPFWNDIFNTLQI